MKIFQIVILFIIIKISISLNCTLMEYNSKETKSSLQPNNSYTYYLKGDYNSGNNYFEFQIELNKGEYSSKSISIKFVKSYFFSIYSNQCHIPSSYSDISETLVSDSELDIKENGNLLVMKWSNSFPKYEYNLGIIIIPKEFISKISIRIKNDCLPDDYITILVFAIFFGVCILLCVLTLIMTKACGSKDSNPIIINQTNPVLMKDGLIQNESVK